MTPPISSASPLAAKGSPRSAAEHEVLRVLWTQPGASLVRSQIHKLMLAERRPTLGRVGQILSAFFNSGLVERRVARAQGSSSASFYTLSEEGRRCAKELGLVQKESLHFPVTEAQLAKQLSSENLCNSRTPGRILTLYGFRGGLGRTMTTAFVAHGLAESLQSGESLLAVDFDLSAPSLDRFLQKEEPQPVRGLAGLLIDFHIRPKAKRALWLRTALRDERYVVQTFAERPLFFLPSGFSERDALAASERAEALTLLHQALEAHRAKVPGPGEDFLSEFRDALLESFTKTVIDCESGRSLGGWIATQALAEDLLICARYEDPSPPTREGIRAVLTSFLERQNHTSGCGRYAVLLRTDHRLSTEQTSKWVRQNLIYDSAEPESSIENTKDYPVVLIETDPRLQALKPVRNDASAINRHGFWTPRAAHFEHLIHWLHGNEPAEAEPPPAGELLGLDAYLRESMSDSGREILWNQIDSWDFTELVHWVDLYLQTIQNPQRRLDSDPEALDPKALARLRRQLVGRFVFFLQSLSLDRLDRTNSPEQVQIKNPAHARESTTRA